MAVAAKATDLIIAAGRPVLLRVASDLQQRTQSVPADQVERIAKDIVPARLRETLEKEGSCEFAVEHLTHGRFRVNVSRQRTGVKLTLRVIAKELPTLASLGLPEAVAAGIRHESGLVVIAGPAGHGKSSTLAALVDMLNRESAKHVATIEEPIEHVHPRKKGFVSQRDVGLHTRTKAKAFHSALRSDPDVVVVHELRDVDSVRLALTAAEGGRLVLGTMNAPGAVQAAERMLRMFGPTEHAWARAALASTLRLVVGQQLVPSADRTRLHAAVELLPASVALWGAIKQGRLHELAGGKVSGKGVVHLDSSLADLVRAQKVTIEVARQYAESPVDLDALVAGRRG
ncbi:MAG: Flp pilus assembly complex ATPase component TadA [Labilithrix sp.]|nr:Flp pilus assembly complex ATPase component TadA [Labilithrix sp.]